jgi:hypothetical protein
MDKGATKPAIPKHERKANLDKFLEGSVAPKLYHGTQVRPESPHGIGDIHKFDRQFTTKFRNPSIDTMGSWFSTNPGKGGAEMYSGAREGSAIYPVHASIKNPFYTTFQKMAKHAREHHNGVDDGRMIGKPEVDAYRKWLISRGMDGVVIKHDKSAPGGNEFKEQDAWIALHPHQVKSATGNRGTYDPKEDDMSKADGGAINAEPLGEDTVKWTSPLADTVNSHKLGSMSGEQWMSWLHANAPKNAKKEAHASGTFDWLPQQANASKEAIVKHMKANAPRIKVKKFGAYESSDPKARAKLERFYELRNEGDVRRLTSDEHDEMEDLDFERQKKLKKTPPSQFDEYQLPGGENYREMTLSHNNHTGDDYIVYGGHGYQDNAADINRVLHMRMNDMPFTYHPNKKALNIEELQSDWAQQGRSRGFQKPVPQETYDRMYALEKKPVDQMSDTERAQLHDIRSLISSKKSKGLPSGPYVQNTEDWTKLGLHNAIKEAAEKGHHAVTWTNGDEQAKRWNEEGLKHYYDTVMPSVANDILKRMGVKERVGQHFLGQHTTGIKTHHGFHMTPEIVAHIKKHGLPRFASGGDISKLKAYMLKKQGTHGAQRVERAADEVPNLENMYELQALKRAFGDDKQSAVAVINPADFERYSSPLSSSGAPQSEIDATVKYLRSAGKFSDVPYLDIHKNGIGEPIIPGSEEKLKSWRDPRIVHHNGRHRSQALTANGEKSSLVRVSPVWDLKKHLKGKTHEEYLDALHKEMAKTDHMVRPETYTLEDGRDQHRPAIALPKMFAKGGRSVEALDRESDEVPIEKRVRDALDKIHLNASGGKDAYGTGAGGRLAVDFPLSKSVTLSPYLEGSAYKPNNQNTSSQISGAGLSLTKRFAEGGKAKFLEPSAEKGRWYHGTNRNIRKFKDANRVHFVSQSPDTANQFAMREHSNGEWGDPIKLDDKEYMEYIGTRSGANVMPVHIQVKNPFDIGKPEHFKAINEHMAKKYASHPEIHENRKSELARAHQSAKDIKDLSYSTFEELEHPHTQRAIKDMGHDSFYTNELGTRNLGIYDPRKIKSAIGNRGTYDTNEHDITKSKGGLAHAFAEGGPVDIPKNILDLHAKDQQLYLDNAVNGHANRHLKLRYTNSWKRLNKAIKAHIGDDPKEVLEYHWKLQDHYNKEHGE